MLAAMATPSFPARRADVSRVLLLALAVPPSGCTVNVYWTDYVVHGELQLGHGAAPRREPIPLAVCAAPTATMKGTQP